MTGMGIQPSEVPNQRVAANNIASFRAFSLMLSWLCTISKRPTILSGGLRGIPIFVSHSQNGARSWHKNAGIWKSKYSLPKNELTINWLLIKLPGSAWHGAPVGVAIAVAEGSLGKLVIMIQPRRLPAMATTTDWTSNSGWPIKFNTMACICNPKPWRQYWFVWCSGMHHGRGQIVWGTPLVGGEICCPWRGIDTEGWCIGRKTSARTGASQPLGVVHLLQVRGAVVPPGWLGAPSRQHVGINRLGSVGGESRWWSHYIPWGGVDASIPAQVYHSIGMGNNVRFTGAHGRFWGCSGR